MKQIIYISQPVNRSVAGAEARLQMQSCEFFRARPSLGSLTFVITRTISTDDFFGTPVVSKNRIVSFITVRQTELERTSIVIFPSRQQLSVSGMLMRQCRYTSSPKPGSMVSTAIEVAIANFLACSIPSMTCVVQSEMLMTDDFLLLNYRQSARAE